jgi:hypothetical protein
LPLMSSTPCRRIRLRFAYSGPINTTGHNASVLSNWLSRTTRSYGSLMLFIRYSNPPSRSGNLLVTAHVPPATLKERSRNTVWPILNLCILSEASYRFWVVSQRCKKRLANRRALEVRIGDTCASCHREAEHCLPNPQRRQSQMGHTAIEFARLSQRSQPRARHSHKNRGCSPTYGMAAKAPIHAITARISETRNTIWLGAFKVGMFPSLAITEPYAQL